MCWLGRRCLPREAAGDVGTGSTELDRVREALRLQTVRSGLWFRVLVVLIMAGAVAAGGDSDRWTKHWALLSAYAVVALGALIIGRSSAGGRVTSANAVKALTAVDIAAVIAFKETSPGGYISLMVMGLLPVAAGLGVAVRHIAVMLAVVFVAFTVELLRDPVIASHLHRPQLALLIAIYGLLCVLRLWVNNSRARYERDIATITASREALLAETMTAAEAERRQISEAIHDGALQDVLAARRDVVDFAKTTPSEQLERAAASLDDASRRLRTATFELHPAVLDQLGLAAAVTKLASVTAESSGVKIATDIDYRYRNGIDPIVFGVARELLANVVRHSRASHAVVKLAVVNGVCRLDVSDNGIGVSREDAARRLAEGHIGLASHRTRVEAAGGTLEVIDDAVGAHIRAEIPVRR